MKQINILLILATVIFISYATFITFKSNRKAKLLNDQFREEKFQQTIVEENALVKVRELIAKAKLHRLGKNLRLLPRERLRDFCEKDAPDVIKGSAEDSVNKGKNFFEALQKNVDSRIPVAIEEYLKAEKEVEDIRKNDAKEFIGAYNRIVAEVPLDGMSESLANDFVLLVIYSQADSFAVSEKLKFEEKLKRAKDIFEFAKAIEIDEVKPEEKEVILTAYMGATPSSKNNWIEVINNFLLRRKGKYDGDEAVISTLEKEKTNKNFSFWKFYYSLPENIKKDILEHFLKGINTGYWTTWRDKMISHIKWEREQKLRELEGRKKDLQKIEYELISGIYEEEKRFFNEKDVNEFLEKASEKDVERFKKLLNDSSRTVSNYTFKQLQQTEQKLEEEMDALKKIPNRQVMRGIFLFDSQPGKERK